MIATALKHKGFKPFDGTDGDFRVSDPVGNGDWRKDFVLEWLNPDLAQPKMSEIIEWIEAIEQGVIEAPAAPKTAEERIAQLEQALETAQNEIGTLKALWQAE